MMNEQELRNHIKEQEREITTILIDSSLYQDMSQGERQKLLDYLIESYFHSLSDEYGRAPSQGYPLRADETKTQ